ncbi:MAG: NAD(P)H-binding protein [Planctomycetota bacterium]
MRVLVVGATGPTGRIICHRLQENGTDFSDRAEVVAFLPPIFDASVLAPLTQRRIGDLENLTPGLLDDIAVVVFAAASVSKTDFEKTVDVDRKGAIALIDLARESGVRHFVMLSAKGADDPDNTEDAIRHYMQAKRAVDDYLIASGVSYTICRPVRLTNDSGTGRVTIAKTVDPIAKISREDLADVMIIAMTHTALQDCIIELGPGTTPIDLAIASYSAENCS